MTRAVAGRVARNAVNIASGDALLTTTPLQADTASVPEQGQRIVGLDAIRAAAILFVVVHHFRAIPGTPDWLKVAGLRGYIGVDLFFVLSGFLIGGQLFRSLRRDGRIDIKRFFVRRWFRTFPSYFAVLAGLWAVGRVSIRELPAMIVFAQNYVNPVRWTISWSLCIEEHFYLVFPLLVVLLRRLGRTATFVALAVLVGGSTVFRWAEFEHLSEGGLEWYLAHFFTPTHLRLDGLVVGVCVGLAREYSAPTWRWCERHGAALATSGAVLLGVTAFSPLLYRWTELDRLEFFPAVPGFLAISIAVGLLVPGANSWRNAPKPFERITVWIAEHAYALYLTHELARGVASKIAPLVGLGWLGRWVAALGTAALLAMVLRRLVEQPALKARDAYVGWLSRTPDAINDARE
jgi:peptidoglycan/LPS O-acetylase OafA/YrhL